MELLITYFRSDSGYSRELEGLCSFIFCACRHPDPCRNSSEMPLDGLWDVQFLEILLLVFRQGLSSNINDLVNSRHAAKSTNGTCDTLVKPCERHLAHLPSLLLRQLLHPVNNRFIRLTRPGGEEGSLNFATRSRGSSFIRSRAREMPST